MKKTNKVISIILAVMLAFSSLTVIASASAIGDEVKTVDALIQSDNLGNTVEWLVKAINDRKEQITGTVLELVLMFVDDDTLTQKIGDTDLTKASDEELAKILIDWLDAMLPVWTKDITGESWWKPATNAVKLVGITIDLNSVDGIVKTLYSLADTNTFGDVSKMEEKALKNVSVKKSGNLGVIHALLQFLADNTDFLKKAVAGKLSFGSLNVADLHTMVNDLVKEYLSPTAIKEMLCDAVELDYNTYKDYTADEIVAAAFLKLLTGADTVSKSEASKVMNLSIYSFLETYAGKIYSNLLLDLLNNDAKTELKKLIDKDTTGTLAKVININYEFKADTFDAYLGASKGNMVDQLNNAVITLLKVVLTDDTFKALKLENGGNDKLNSNLTKTFRYILPLIKDLDLGVDLSGFTADKVKNMSAEEMAVAVLKLFYKGWFKNADMNEVNKAKTLEQLGVLAAKYAVTNNEWVPMDIISVKKAVNVEKMSDEACLELVYEIGMETAAKALDYNKKTTYYELPKDTSKWTGDDYLDDIVDWALNFVSGLPAIADTLTTERHVLDGNGGFYKLNVVLNELFDLSFVSGCGNEDFAVDIETMIMDEFLGNLFNFDIEAAVALLAQNEEASVFNKKINEAVIDVVDDLLTALFEYAPAYTLGDVDDNGTITAADARLALRASVELEKLTETQTLAADADKNGTITAADARLILRASVGLETLA